MEINDCSDRGYIAVWLTNEEQQTVDRTDLTKRLLADAGHPKKCKVVFYLSGNESLYNIVEGLLCSNAKL